MWVLVPQLSERSDLSLSDPARRSRRPVPSRPEAAGAARPSRRSVGTARRGRLWGRGVRLPRVLGFSCFIGGAVSGGEKTFLAGLFFSVCGVLFCEFGEQAPAAVPAGDQSSLSWKSASQREKKMQIWVVWFFFFFLSFFLKKKRENYYFLEGLIAWLRATELKSFVTVDCVKPP